MNIDNEQHLCQRSCRTTKKSF